MFSFLKDKDGGNAKGYLPLILVAAAIGILLLLFGGTGDRTKTQEQIPDEKSAEEELSAYQKTLETKIQRLCESVNGIDHATVTVTLSGGFTTVYATEWKDGNEKYVILGSGSSATALYLTRAAPEIAGIGIVCDAQNLDRARYELISLLAATFNVSSHRIYVTAAK